MAVQGGQYHYERMKIARLVVLAAFVLVAVAVFAVPALIEQRTVTAFFGAAVLVVLGMAACAVSLSRIPEMGLLFELETRQKFQAVCRERKLVTKDAAGRLVYPRIRSLAGGQVNGQLVLTMEVVPLPGQDMAMWERATDALAWVFKVEGVRLADNGGGVLRFMAGYQPIEVRPFVPPAPVLDVDRTDWRELLASVVIGSTEAGRPYAVPLLDTHLLVAGMMGAGKGSVIWSLILGLRPALEAGVVRLWGFDPKRMELSIGRQFFGDRYAMTAVEMVELLERAAAEMHARAEALGGHVRRFTPSSLHPANVLVVDELGFLSSMLSDRNLKKRADEAMALLLSQGRSVGYIVVGALQDPRKETLAYRDLFPTRIAMRLPAAMVDLVLGPGARDDGARCDLIPPGKDGAGMAFVLSENSTVPLCVRMHWCSDELIKSTAAALLLPSSVPLLDS